MSHEFRLIIYAPYSMAYFILIDIKKTIMLILMHRTVPYSVVQVKI